MKKSTKNHKKKLTKCILFLHCLSIGNFKGTLKSSMIAISPKN